MPKDRLRDYADALIFQSGVGDTSVIREVSMMQVGLNNYQFVNSNVMERTDNKNVEKKTEDKYASVSAYQAYLKDKYSCLSARDYRVTISPVYF